MRLLLLIMIVAQIIPFITANTIFIPRVVIQAGYPSGFRAYVPDFPGMQYFAFHGQLSPINGPRRILRGIIRAPVNGYWIYQDDDCLLRTSDVVSYTTHMVINRVSYKSPSVTWTCPEPSLFVDFKAPLPPVRKLPTPSQPKPTNGTENPELRSNFSPPSPELKSETSPPEVSTQSTAAEKIPEIPGTSPSSQTNQPTTSTSISSITSSVTTEATSTSSESSPVKETSPSSTQSTPSTDTTTSGTQSPSNIVTTPATETPSSNSQSASSTMTTPSNQISTLSGESQMPKDVNSTPKNDKTAEQTTENMESTKESTPATTTSEKSTESSSIPTDSTEPSSESTGAETSPDSTTPKLDLRSGEPSDAKTNDDQQSAKPDNNSESTTPSMYIPVSEQPEEPNDENQPLFPGPFKPMMPSKGPSFEICSNPWNFVPRENETKTQKLEKQIAKLQCDLALFQRKFMQLGQVLEGELTDIKNLNTGVASRMSRLESVLKSASEA